MVKILRKSQENHKAQFPIVSAFIDQNSIFCRYCIKNIRDKIQIQVYNLNNKCVNHCSQFILVKA